MSVYEKFVPIFAQKAQELTLQLPDTALPSVFADEQRLEQILSILLDNAHSYAPEGSSVQLRVDQCEEGKTRFWVVDHGPGIPDEEKMDQEVRPFRKIPDSFRRILVVGDDIRPWMNDEGVLIVGIWDFLLDESILT